ncbi:hypothetical protein KBC54_02950 [Patescibacteria group bacterium]|nr:hypothetical protein [Patescibacteria group bacterium]
MIASTRNKTVRLGLCIGIAVCGLFGRIAFAETIPSCSNITDPSGDPKIQSETATTTVGDVGRIDMTSVQVDRSAGQWIFSIETVRPFQRASNERGNILLLLDRDGDVGNNYPDATDARAGADSYYIINPVASSTSVMIKHQVHDSMTNTWQQLVTSSTAKETGTLLIVTIPTTELDTAQDIRWRVFAGMGDGNSWLASDAAPNRSADPSACGYLPIPPSLPGASATSTGTMSISPPSRSISFQQGLIYIGVMGSALVFGFLVLRRKRETS